MTDTPAVTETVPNAFDEERLDRFVSLLVDCSRSQSAKLIKQGSVLVNGKAVTTRSRPVSAGDKIEILVLPEPKNQPPEPDSAVEFEVVHEDEDLIVVNKPAGLVVHPGSGNQTGTLVNGLLAAFGELSTVGEIHRPGIVHRLDSGTSGLLLVARTQLAYAELVSALAARRISRRYITLVWGDVEANEGLIDAPIGRSPRDPLKMALIADGKEARTRYEVLGRTEEPILSALGCELETGRTHQIRVHLSAIDHAVVGDARYGGVRGSLPFGRPALHAHRLELSHPTMGTRLSFEAPIPTDMAELFGRVGLEELA